MASVWPLVGTWAMDINTDYCWGRTTKTDMALGSRPGLDVTMVLGSKLATHISLFLTTFASSVLPLSKAHEAVRFSSLPYVFHHNGVYPSSVTRHQVGLDPWIYSASPETWGPRWLCGCLSLVWALRTQVGLQQKLLSLIWINLYIFAFVAWDFVMLEKNHCQGQSLP